MTGGGPFGSGGGGGGLGFAIPDGVGTGGAMPDEEGADDGLAFPAISALAH